MGDTVESYFEFGDVSGQEAAGTQLRFDELLEDVRDLLFGEAEKIEPLYERQYYTVKASGDSIYCIASAQGGSPDNPRAVAWLPPGFFLLGGGARANWQSSGSMLTASSPIGGAGRFGWEARCLGDDESGGSLSVYAIGVKVGDD